MLDPLLASKGRPASLSASPWQADLAVRKPEEVKSLLEDAWRDITTKATGNYFRSRVAVRRAITSIYKGALLLLGVVAHQLDLSVG